MRLQNISFEDIVVNRSNDRHGELLDEEAGIEWLLTHRASHMRKLAQDIVSESKIYEPPLVHEEGGKYTVYDGNRRVTCLKLLAAPQKAPTSEWASFFVELRSKWRGTFPDKIPCRVETDRDEIDEILFRRHTGSRGGVGQSQWDAEAKSNFEGRTGKKTKINLAEEIENILRDAGYLTRKKIPRSNLNRLLSAEAFRNRVGISISGNKLEFTHEREKALAALSRVVEDLASKKTTLDDIWDNTSKRKYLNALDAEGILPNAEDAISPSTESIIEAQPSNPQPDKPEKHPPTDHSGPVSRTTLIRNIDYGLVAQADNQRALDIWNELKYRLHFGKHDNAIAVLFRVLVELSIENYATRKNVGSIQKGDKLALRYTKVLKHMVANGDIQPTQAKDLQKFERSEAVFSANTFNSYVHHSSFFPSDYHLKSMWDTVAPFVVACLKAE